MPATSVIVALLVATVFATPTTRIPYQSFKLPWHFLTEDWSDMLPSGRPSLKVFSKDELRARAIDEQKFVVASGQYNHSVRDLGWDFIRINTERRVMRRSLPEAYYYAGYLEGVLSATVINRTVNFSAQVPSPAVGAWIEKQIEFLEARATNLSSVSPFWHQVDCLLRQNQGLVDGFNNATGLNITFFDMFVNQLGPEVEDIAIAASLHDGNLDEAKRVHNDLVLSPYSHCSALIKVTHDDLFTAQDTWSSFSSVATRMYKVYDFQTTVVFSGYPASTSSGDDWYMTSNNLAVQETTNLVWNMSLYTAVVPETVSEWIRVMAGNYLAKNGRQWVSYFKTLNSGTYNNQYMVVDYNLYTPGKRLVDGTLWVAEQIPGYVEARDETEVLRRTSYWASYNWAYFSYIYNVSGYETHKEEYGSFWSYSKYARAEIFRRNNSDVVDMSSMQRMMRYNNFHSDPLSLIPNCTGGPYNNTCNPKHSAMLAIASRGDLNPFGNNTYYGPVSKWINYQPNFGAIDSKITSSGLMKKLTGVIISGPTSDEQPVFRWSTSNFANLKPWYSADTYDYPWLQVQI